jgi:hypothetical protein
VQRVGIRGKAATKTKRAAARAMVELGVPLRVAGKELGVSHQSVLRWSQDPDMQPEVVEQIKARISDRLVVASDRYLTASLDRIQELHPYQAMLCAGIAHDHYLRSTQAGRGHQAGGLTQILIQIDASLRATTTSSMPPGDVDAT